MTAIRSNNPKERAIEAMRKLVRSREPAHVRARAIVGDGAGNVAATWDNYYWVRLVGKTEMVVQAYCDTMIPGDGMHVYVEEEHREGQRFYRIVGRPDSQGWFTATRGASGAGSPAPEHHVVHETGGSDMINVGSYMIEELRGGPTDPASMKVRVSWAANVTFGRENKPFPSDGSQYKDSAAITAPMWGSRFDLVSIDEDLDINITAGATSWGSPDKPGCPDNEIPICWVLLKVGDTAIAADRFWPANSLHAVGVLHAADHENGGGDEISVAGLSGVLADDQDADHLLGRDINVEVPDDGDALVWDATSSSWKPSATVAPAAHASSHEDEGDDEISVAGLSGELADPQPPKTHATDHENGGGDEISVAGLSGVLADKQDADKLQSNDIDNGAPSNNDVLAWDAGASKWVPKQLDEVDCPWGCNDVSATVSSITYVGKERPDGSWWIMKLDETSGLAIGHAAIGNNPTVATYADAWTARATTLVYGDYSEAFG